MDPTTQKPKIHVITDSGGVDSQAILSEDIISDQRFVVTVISGAILEKLTQCAVKNQEKYDLQIIAGGICDITIKEGKCISFREDSKRLAQMEHTIKNAQTILRAKFLFANISYAHIDKYNNFRNNCVKRKGKGICISPPPITHNKKSIRGRSM